MRHPTHATTTPLVTTLLLATLTTSALAADLCIGPSAANGFNITVDCQGGAPEAWPNAVVGFSTDGSPCTEGLPCGSPSQYVWTVSASSTDPFVNSGTLGEAPATLYLWYTCHLLGPIEDGMSSAEFGLHGSLEILDVTVHPPFLWFMPSTEDFLVAVGGCPQGPIVVADLVVQRPVPVEGRSWGTSKALYR